MRSETSIRFVFLVQKLKTCSRVPSFKVATVAFTEQKSTRTVETTEGSNKRSLWVESVKTLGVPLLQSL